MALSVALAVAFSYPCYLNSHRILSDVPFSLVLWGTLYAALTMLNFINTHNEFDYIVLEPSARHAPAADSLAVWLNRYPGFRATRSGTYVLYSRLK